MKTIGKIIWSVIFCFPNSITAASPQSALNRVCYGTLRSLKVWVAEKGLDVNHHSVIAEVSLDGIDSDIAAEIRRVYGVDLARDHSIEFKVPNSLFSACPDENAKTATATGHLNACSYRVVEVDPEKFENQQSLTLGHESLLEMARGNFFPSSDVEQRLLMLEVIAEHPAAEGRRILGSRLKLKNPVNLTEKIQLEILQRAVNSLVEYAQSRAARGEGIHVLDETPLGKLAIDAAAGLIDINLKRKAFDDLLLLARTLAQTITQVSSNWSTVTSQINSGGYKFMLAIARLGNDHQILPSDEEAADLLFEFPDLWKIETLQAREGDLALIRSNLKVLDVFLDKVEKVVAQGNSTPQWRNYRLLSALQQLHAPKYHARGLRTAIRQRQPRIYSLIQQLDPNNYSHWSPDNGELPGSE